MHEPPLLVEWQRVTHRLLLALDDALGDLKLTAGEVNALACFGGADAIPLRELVRATGQRPSTLTGVLDRLERRGLLGRAPQPGDRRALQVSLTADGRAARVHVDAAFADLGRRLPAAARGLLAAVDGSLG